MKREESLFSNTVILGVASAFSKAVVFFLLPLYTAALTPSEFGESDILVSTAVLLLPFVSLNAPEAVFRFFAGAKPDERSSVFSAATRLLGCGLLLLPLLFFAAGGVPLLRRYRVYLLFYLLASVLRSYLAHVLRAEGRYRLYALQQVVCALLTVLLQVLFLTAWQMGVRGYLLGVILADGSVFFLLLFLVRPWRLFSARAVRSKSFSAMLSYALPLMPTAALWWVISISDRYIILHYCGAAKTGLYAAAARLPTALTFLVGIFMEAWHYAAIKTEKGREGQLFGRIYAMLLPALVCGAAALLVGAYPVVSLFFDTAYTGATAFVPFLTLAALFSALSTFLGSIYAVKLKSVASLFTALFGALLNLLLNFLLIPHWGAIGAALATMVAYAAVFLLRLWHSKHYLAFSHHGGKLLLSVAFLLLAARAVIGGAYLLALLPAFLSLLPFLPLITEALAYFCKRLCVFLKIRQKSGKRY